MFSDSNDQALTRYLRQFSQGEYLFRQGDRGDSCFVIVEGEILLFYQGVKSEKLVEVVRSGSLVGENAIAKGSNSQRTYTAQARASSLILEFDIQTLKLLQSKIPEFTLRIVKMLSERLEASHRMINTLQAENPLEKLIFYLVYRSKSGVDASIALDLEEIESQLNIKDEFLQNALSALCQQRALKKTKLGYFVQDADNLIEQLSELKQYFAA